MPITLFWDIVSWILLLTGSLFVIAGGIGIARLPDFFTRLHPAGVTDTIGAGLILAGLMVQAGPTQAAAKLALILLFLFFTSPTATHALAKTALRAGAQPISADRSDSEPDDTGGNNPLHAHDRRGADGTVD